MGVMRRAGTKAGEVTELPAVDVVGNGDGSFESFYESEYRQLLRIAWGMEGRRELAEEAVQDAMMSVHQNWERVSTYDKPAMYARRVLLNALVSRDRRRRRERRAVERVGPTETVHPDTEPPRDDVWAALRSLPDRQQQAVTLFYVEDRSVAAIAEVLDIAEATVRVHLHRGRHALAEQLTPSVEEERQ
jgi:RNA polymerase sigma-70 factor, ECF subfamily